MEKSASLFAFIDTFYIIYGLVLFLAYLSIGIFSSLELAFYNNRNKYFNFEAIANYKDIPSVSIIAPCYNEELTIVENIRSLLSLKYPNLEVIIINDGSTDNSLRKMKEKYVLTRVDYVYEEYIKTSQVRGVYKSMDKAYAQLTVIDKENGGKADALNAGINISRKDLFLAIDVDCIIEAGAIKRMVKPFLEEAGERKVIASGGVVRVANNCEVEHGQIVKVNFPKNLWAQYQTLEYLRVFTLSRMAWSKVNGLLIISGAFGMFDRKIVIASGGYDRNSVGEDLELVIRMRDYMHRVAKEKYKVAFIPDPLCWTEVPENLKTLARQRNRWTRGLIDTLIKHRRMFFNRKYGLIGMVSFPFWFFFEWMAPIVETLGFIYFGILIYLGRINPLYFGLFLAFVLSFSLLYSSFSVFYEKYSYNRYKDYGFIFKVLFITISELILYHPLLTVFALKGNFDYFIRRKKGWGTMKRKGFKARL